MRILVEISVASFLAANERVSAANFSPPETRYF